MAKLSYQLADLRAANDMTQRYMAEEIGVAKSTYNMYETGLRSIPTKKAGKIAEILGVDINELFYPIKYSINQPTE